MAQNAGSVRGVVVDKDFASPVGQVQIQIVETGDKAITNDDGTYVIPDVPPGQYTLIFAKSDYTREVKTVAVAEGQLVDVDVQLAGEFYELEPFVAQDLQLSAGSELGLLNIRFKVPGFENAISSELISRSGASDAASAIKLISGATVSEGKYAVVRGLPDRYVVSLMNGVRLPSADEDKRAVQLDQFPSAVIDAIRVTKTFTPDQQGDSSGGAVNIVLKGIPESNSFSFKVERGFNSQVSDSSFLTYDGGGVNFWGLDDGLRDIQTDNIGMNWEGPFGVSTAGEPPQYKWSVAGGGKIDIGSDLKVGGFGSLFYDRDASFYNNGIDDSYWVTTPGEGLTPQFSQGTPGMGNFKTSLFDVTQGTQSVQWGTLGTFGIEGGGQAVKVVYLYTRTTEDTATLAQNTRGKEYFFPGYDPNDPFAEANNSDNINASPYLRNETLDYSERTTQTFQVNGTHKFPIGPVGPEGLFQIKDPELDWTLSMNKATQDQPDKRQFGSLWLPSTFVPGIPFLGIPDKIDPPQFQVFKPGEVFALGNVQRIWKSIEESGRQFSVNFTIPFTQWSDSEGYFKFGIFDDRTRRTYDQETFSNFNDNSTFVADYSVLWSQYFGLSDHPFTDGGGLNPDVDYNARQTISAAYWMVDVPLTSFFNAIGGVRYESTELGVDVFPSPGALFYPPPNFVPTFPNPDDVNVDFHQDDALPSLGIKFTPWKPITLRAAYTETVARQTFKELTPIQQQEYLGADVFLGNPELQMSALRNYDLRLEYVPFDGSLFAVSWFKKDITDPIEYVQRVATFNYTTPVNYPNGELSGVELEGRADMGSIWDGLRGLTLGANATFIDSEVFLPADEAAMFEASNIQAPMPSRDMTNAPEYLYNLFVTYDFDLTGTQVGLFYTAQGDSLVAGAGESDGNFIPNVYALGYGTLNFTLSQKLGKHFRLGFSAKNLTDPMIDEVYRSPYIGDDVLKTSYTKGIDYSVSLSAQFAF